MCVKQSKAGIAYIEEEGSSGMMIILCGIVDCCHRIEEVMYHPHVMLPIVRPQLKIRMLKKKKKKRVSIFTFHILLPWNRRNDATPSTWNCRFFLPQSKII